MTSLPLVSWNLNYSDFISTANGAREKLISLQHFEKSVFCILCPLSPFPQGVSNEQRYSLGIKLSQFEGLSHG
jgi:hypothetical protein